MVASAPARITPHRAPPYEEMDLRHEFAHLFSLLRKINKNCCHQSCTLTPVCTKSFLSWGFAPDTTGGAYSTPPDTLAGFKGPYF